MNETFTAMQSKSLSKETTAMYLRRKLHFINWLKTNHPLAVGGVGEFDLGNVTTEMMCNYIDQLSKKPDGSLKTISTPEAVYSALISMFKIGKRKLPDDFREEWARYAKGYKNTAATARQAGHLPLKGSDKLNIDEYRTLCKVAASCNKFYVHAFLIFAWNCMTRLGDTAEIKFEHLSFENDHIVIGIPRHKADPTGELTPTGKSIYANPIYPEICAFLAIGILVLSRKYLRLPFPRSR